MRASIVSGIGADRRSISQQRCCLAAEVLSRANFVSGRGAFSTLSVDDRGAFRMPRRLVAEVLFDAFAYLVG